MLACLAALQFFTITSRDKDILGVNICEGTRISDYITDTRGVFEHLSPSPIFLLHLLLYEQQSEGR